MLFRDELDAYLADPAAFTEQLREREHTYLALFDVVPPFVVDGAPPHSEQWARRGAQASIRATVGEVITGVSGCTGTARGLARITRLSEKSEVGTPAMVPCGVRIRIGRSA